MAPIPIRLYGDPVLRQRAAELSHEDITSQFRAMIDDMVETMYGASGIGLAANQVGIARRFFITDTDQVSGVSRRNGKRLKDETKRRLVVYINPEVIDSSADDEPYNEGCLSIPEVEHDVYRPKSVKVRYRTLEWELREEWLEALPARVFQHELDHLDGILFVDRLAEEARFGLAGRLNRMKKRPEPATT